MCWHYLRHVGSAGTHGSLEQIDMLALMCAPPLSGLSMHTAVKCGTKMTGLIKMARPLGGSLGRRGSRECRDMRISVLTLSGWRWGQRRSGFEFNDSLVYDRSTWQMSLGMVTHTACSHPVFVSLLPTHFTAVTFYPTSAGQQDEGQKDHKRQCIADFSAYTSASVLSQRDSIMGIERIVSVTVLLMPALGIKYQNRDICAPLLAKAWLPS